MSRFLYRDLTIGEEQQYLINILNEGGFGVMDIICDDMMQIEKPYTFLSNLESLYIEKIIILKHLISGTQ